MEQFLQTWNEAAMTTLGLFWMAFWAFGLGYLISAMIQVFVAQKKMKQSMGEAGAKSVVLGTFFGFISSSCSFSALSTTRALFAKGASLIPSLAFLLASTNLVIELGVVIAIFLSWQFVVGEYVGGLILILLMWLLVKLTLPENLSEEAREHAREEEGTNDEEEVADWKQLIKSKDGWQQVANKYVMEWKMVWKDVTVGFTVAGIIAAFVPKSFFHILFIGSDSDQPVFLEVLAQALIGPVAAFFTFIGSMGNIPLAAVLFSNGVSFAGVIAFIFSDLVVFPVLRIQAKYYGWKMAFYILAIFLFILVTTALMLHYGFAALDLLPDSNSAKDVIEREYFKIDYTLFLNLLFITLSAVFLGWKLTTSGLNMQGNNSISEKILYVLSWLAFAWLITGLVLPLI